MYLSPRSMLRSRPSTVCGGSRGTGERVDSTLDVDCMSATFRVQDAVGASGVLMGNGSSVAEDETVREVAVRQVAGGALREVASQER